MTLEQARIVLLAILFAGALTSANADVPNPIYPFLGEYQGHSIKDSASVLTIHDIGVRITLTDAGFTVHWSMVTRHSTGEFAREQFTVHFVPTRREHIYASAMAPNLFGKDVPLNPLEGEPFIWARIVDETLSVYAMFVTESGGHDMQIYERKLSEDGMQIKIQRLRDETPFRVVTGTLQRTH